MPNIGAVVRGARTDEICAMVGKGACLWERISETRSRHGRMHGSDAHYFFHLGWRTFPAVKVFNQPCEQTRLTTLRVGFLFPTTHVEHENNTELKSGYPRYSRRANDFAATSPCQPLGSATNQTSTVFDGQQPQRVHLEESYGFHLEQQIETGDTSYSCQD